MFRWWLHYIKFSANISKYSPVFICWHFEEEFLESTNLEVFGKFEISTACENLFCSSTVSVGGCVFAFGGVLKLRDDNCLFTKLSTDKSGSEIHGNILFLRSSWELLKTFESKQPAKERKKLFNPVVHGTATEKLIYKQHSRVNVIYNFKYWVEQKSFGRNE